ncbi:MAG: D-aminoacylase [Gemmatimonadetes bacterium]|nr:D-aminoacylase [Gemmatimonadota bacterium]
MPPSETLDVLIVHGTVVDGTGVAGVESDVGVLGGEIVWVGRSRRAAARDTVDATGLVVAPGFIDSHNHTAPEIAELDKRLNEGFIRQGVTTVVGGPDGGFSPGQIRRLIGAYEANGVGTNVAFYVGHNGIRREVMGEEQRRAPTAEELARMKALVREGMELGALGFSTGLMYEPGMFSTTDEVVELAKEAAPFQGVYDTHDRSPVRDYLGSVREAIAIGERAGIPSKEGHLKTVGLENRGKNREVIAMVDSARARGLPLVSDQYPYDGAATSTLERIVVVPEALAKRAGFDLEAALRDPRTRAVLKESSENGIDGGFAWIKATGYSSMRVTRSADYPDLVGRYLSELAAERELDGFDLVAELILGAKDTVGITLGAVLEEDVRELMVQPWNMIASDGAYSDGITPRGHPRSTGTFARVLGRYVRETKLLTLEQAVYKMSGFPAEFHGFQDRGRIAEGMAADIVVFDPATIADRSTWEQPQLYAAGVHQVLVNGAFVVRDGELTGEAPGKFLARQR